MNIVLNEMIKKLRKDRGFTQENLSDLLGLERQTISAYEKGIREPSIKILSKMAEIFEVSIDILVFGFKNDMKDVNKSSKHEIIKEKLQFEKNNPKSFLKHKDIVSNFNISSLKETTTTIIGLDPVSGKCVSIKEEDNDDITTMVLGFPGSGKTQAVFLPYLMQCIKRNESVIISDPKGEIFDRTEEKFKQAGYNVKVLNFVQPEHSDYWNIINELISVEKISFDNLNGFIDVFENFVETDVFLKNICSVLLKSFLLFVLLDETKTIFNKSLRDIYNLTLCDERKIDAMFSRLKQGHPAKQYWNIFKKNDYDNRTRAYITLSSFLEIPSKQQLLSENIIDTTKPALEKSIYYVIPSMCGKKYNFLAAAYFDIMMRKILELNTNEIQKIPVNFVLEEMCELGRIPNIPLRIGQSSSNMLKYIMAINSMSAFKQTYTNEEYKTLVQLSKTVILTSSVPGLELCNCNNEEINEYLIKSGNKKQVVVMPNKGTVLLDKYFPETMEVTSDVRTYLPQAKKKEINNIMMAINTNC